MSRPSFYILVLFSIFLLGYPEAKAKEIHPDFFKNYSQSMRKLRGGFSHLVSDVAYDDKNKKLIVGRDIGEIDIWDMAKENSRITIKSTPQRPEDIYFTKDRNEFFSSFKGNSVNLWDVISGNLVCALSGFHGPVVETHFPGLFVVAKISSLHLFHREDCHLHQEEVKTHGVVQSLGTNAEGQLIAVGNSTGVIELFEIQNNSKEYSLKKIAEATMDSRVDAKDWVMGVHFSPDGRSLYAVSRRGSIEQYEVPSLQKQQAHSSALKAIFTARLLPEKDILALTGTLSEGGFGTGHVQMLSFIKGESVLESANITTPAIDFMPSLDKLLVLESRTTKLLDFPGSASATLKPSEPVKQSGEVIALEQAASDGEAKAQYKLAARYYRGDGVPQDRKKSFDWAMKAAEQGDIFAQYAVAELYYSGKGVLQNREIALLWYEKAAIQGDADAQNMLGVMYFGGEGVPQNIELALIWYEKAAKQGNALAQVNLASTYDRGIHLPQDEKKAFEWYTKAAMQNNTYAQSRLGELYYSGKGVAENKEKACLWYEKAAIQDDIVAQARLGKMLLNGEGCTQDFVLAYSWLFIAVESGSRLAKGDLPIAKIKLAKKELSEAKLLIKEWDKGKALARKYNPPFWLENGFPSWLMGSSLFLLLLAFLLKKITKSKRQS